MECVFWILCSMFLILKGSKATHPCPSPPCLFYTDRTTIKAFQLSHGSSQSTVLSNLYRAAAITVDVRRNLLFWSDRKRDVIQCLNLTSGRTQDIVTDDVGSVRDLAVDWETGLLYWTDYGKKHISVVTYDGAKRKTLINAGVLKPHGIAVDPRNGLLFWTDLGSKPRIQKATLSGHNQTTIVDLNPLGQRWPHGITIDYSNNRLYWIDSYMDQIMSVDFNGKNSILYHSDFNFHAYSLDMYGNLLYWSDSVGRSTTIRTVAKSGSVGHGGYYDVGYSTDMGIAIYHKSRQPRGNLSCLPANHNCQYLCLLSPRGSQCACPDGKILDKDGKSCKDSSKSILFTESGKVRYIFQIPLDVPQPVKKRLPLYNLGEPNAIDVDPVDKRVYWSESWQPSISRAFLNGTSQQQILRLVRTPDGLAVDWVGGNIYWTDREANKIEVAKLDGKYRKTLIFKNLERPTNVIVDLRKGYLYWGSAGGNLPPKVEQADMTGYNRRVLANLVYPARPTGLAISDNRLYWIDEYHRVLQYVDRVTPQGVVTLHLSPRLSDPSVLASLGVSLYLLDSGRYSNDGDLVKIDKNTGKIVQNLTWFLNQPLGISAVDFNSTLTPVSQACTKDNGNCSHLCLLGPTGRKCACPNVMRLKNDEKTCYFKEFLLYADAGNFRRRGIYKLSLSDSTSTPVKLPLSNIRKPTALDFDPLENFVYWTDVYSQRIMRAHLDGGSQSSIITSSLRKPQGLAVDVIGRNLYWTDRDRNVIEVSKLNGSFRKVLVSNLDQPKAIVLDGRRGYMYWSSWGHQSKIERINMDGDNRVLIKSFTNPPHWSSAPPSPNGLALDSQTNLLYWIDEYVGVLQYIDLALSPYRVRNLISYHQFLISPFGLALNEEHVYWSEQGFGGGIFRIGKLNGNRVTRVATTSASPRDVHVYHNATAIPDSHPCTINNGWCTHLCLVNPTGYKCACPTISTPGRPCLTVPNRLNVTASPSPPTPIQTTAKSSTIPQTTMQTTSQQLSTTTTQPTTTEQPTTAMTRSTSKQETSTTAPTTEEHTTSSTTIPTTEQATTKAKTTTTTTKIPSTNTMTTKTTKTPSTTTMKTKTKTPSTTTMKTKTTKTPSTTTMTTKTTKTPSTTTMTTKTPSTTTKTKQSTIITTQKPQTSSTPFEKRTTPTPNPCLSNPCDNKGKCVQTQDNQDGFACQCEEGFASKLCDVFYGENKVEITFKMKLEDWKTPEFQAGMARIVNEYCSKNDCKPKNKRRRRSSGPLYFTPDDIIVAGDPKAVSNGIKVRVVILEPQQENPSGPRKPMSESLLCVIMRDTKETRSSVLKGYNIMALNGEKEPKCVGGAGTAGKSKGNRSGASSSSSVLAGGIIVGLCILVLVLIVFFIYRKRKQRRQMEENESRSHATFNNPGFTEDQGADTLLSNPTYEEIGPELRDEILGLSTSLPWQEEFRGATNPVYYEVDRGSAAGAAHAQTRAPVELEEDKLKEKMTVDLKPEGNGNHDNSRNGGNQGNGDNDGKSEERYVEIPAHHKTIKQPGYSSIPAGRFKPKVEKTEPEPEYASIPTVRFKQKVDRQKSDYSSIPAGPIKAKAKTDEKPSCVDRSSDSDDRYEGGNLSEAKKSNQNKRPRIAAPPPEDPTLNGIYEYPDGTVEGSKDKRIYVNADEINGSPLKDDSNKHNVNADIIKELNDGEITAKNGKRKKPSLNKQAQGHGGNNDQKGQKEREIKDHENGRAPSKRGYQLEERVTSDEAIS